MALIAVVFLVVKSPNTQPVTHQSAVAGATATASGPLDQLSSADIAVHVARMTSLPEAVAITNQADSEATQLAITATETKVVAKPQVVATSLKSAKDINTYTAASGDTLSSLAAKFGVTSDSIRWSNGLSSEKIPAGKQLVIPPVSGVVYTVKSGDTVDSLAQKYSSSKDQILADNDAEVAGIKTGQQILIRGGIQPVARVAAAVTTTYSGSGGFFGGSAQYGYNGYDYGYCTWYVANKRLANGSPMPTNLGNAATWVVRARSYGLATGSVPRAGAAAVTSTAGAGHVVYVEHVNDDGSILISEMNARGWGVVDSRTIPADQASRYGYFY